MRRREGPARTPRPAFLALFAGKRDAKNLVASIFGPFCWQAGREEPRCKHFCRISLAAGTPGSTWAPGITEAQAEIPGQARNEEERPGRRENQGQTKTRTGAGAQNQAGPGPE